MAMQTVTVSLSRAHKLAERLTRELDKRVSGAYELIRPIQAITPSQATKADQKRSQFIGEVALMNGLRSALKTISVAIAAKNCEVHIPQLLKEQKLLSKHQQHVALLLNQLNDTSVIEASEVADFIEQQKGLGGNIRYPQVAVLDQGQISEMKTQLAALGAEGDALSDKINSVNTGAKISVEIDESVAALIGLQPA